MRSIRLGGASGGLGHIGAGDRTGPSVGMCNMWGYGLQVYEHSGVFAPCSDTSVGRFWATVMVNDGAGWAAIM
jgi:hypothetical protein